MDDFATAPVSRRNKLAKSSSRGAPRPKSQPALMHDVFSAASSSHSSQEELRAGRSPAPDRLHGYQGTYQCAPAEAPPPTACTPPPTAPTPPPTAPTPPPTASTATKVPTRTSA